MISQHTFFIGLQSAQSEGISDVLIAKLELAAIDAFGGYSHSIVNGGWRSPSGEVFREQSLRLEVVSDCTDPQVTAFAAYARGLFHQESVLVTTSSPLVRFL